MDLGTLRIRERYGIGGVLGDGVGRVTLARNNNLSNSVNQESLLENIRMQLEEQNQNEQQQERDARNIFTGTVRGRLSDYAYFNEPIFGVPNIEIENVGFYDNPFEEKVSSSTAELRNALNEEAYHMMAEFNLRPNDLMFLLSVEGYEILRGDRKFFREFIGIEVNISSNQTDLYEVIIKGDKGYKVARARANALRK